MFIQVTEEQLPEEILNSELSIVYFGGETCSACKSYMPVVEKIAENYNEGILYCEVNVDKNPELASKYKIRGLPSIIVLKKGERVDKIIGSRPYDELENKLKNFM